MGSLILDFKKKKAFLESLAYERIRWICDYTRVDRIWNEVIRDLLKVTPIEDKMREIRLK